MPLTELASASPSPVTPSLQGGSELTGDERPAVKAKPRSEKNRVLVTGGAGFVGSHLCDYLVARGDHVGAAALLFSEAFCAMRRCRALCGCCRMLRHARWLLLLHGCAV